MLSLDSMVKVGMIVLFLVALLVVVVVVTSTVMVEVEVLVIVISWNVVMQLVGGGVCCSDTEGVVACSCGLCWQH